MDQTTTPKTPADPQDSPAGGDTKTQQAARRLFDTGAPTKRTPIAVPPTKQVNYQTDDSLTGVNREISEVKTFMKTQETQNRDLHAQLSALTQQMTNLATIFAQQSQPQSASLSSNSGTAAAIPATLGVNTPETESSKPPGNSSDTDASKPPGNVTYRQQSASNSGAAAVHSPSSVLLSNHLTTNHIDF
jgi:hypothetical protein